MHQTPTTVHTPNTVSCKFLSFSFKWIGKWGSKVVQWLVAHSKKVSGAKSVSSPSPQPEDLHLCVRWTLPLTPRQLGSKCNMQRFQNWPSCHWCDHCTAWADCERKTSSACHGFLCIRCLLFVLFFLCTLSPSVTLTWLTWAGNWRRTWPSCSQSPIKSL